MRCRLSSGLEVLLLWSSVAVAQAPVPAAPVTAAPVAASSRRVVPLAEALKLASKNNHDYQAALANAVMVQVQTNRVWGALLPEVTLNGSLVHVSNPTVLDTSAFIPGALPYVIVAQN